MWLPCLWVYDRRKISSARLQAAHCTKAEEESVRNLFLLLNDINEPFIAKIDGAGKLANCLLIAKVCTK